MQYVTSIDALTIFQNVESKTASDRISLPKDNYENKITYLPVRADRNDPRMEPIADRFAGAECAVCDCRAIGIANNFCSANDFRIARRLADGYTGFRFR